MDYTTARDLVKDWVVPIIMLFAALGACTTAHYARKNAQSSSTNTRLHYLQALDTYLDTFLRVKGSDRPSAEECVRQVQYCLDHLGIKFARKPLKEIMLGHSGHLFDATVFVSILKRAFAEVPKKGDKLGDLWIQAFGGVHKDFPEYSRIKALNPESRPWFKRFK